MGHRAEKLSEYANPNHPDLQDPYRELRRLMRPMRPEEESQRPFDFGNVNQNQLAVDGYASKVEAIIGGAREGDGRKFQSPVKGLRHPDSKATRPDGWQTSKLGDLK